MHNPDLEQNPADDFQRLYLLHRGRVRDYVCRRATSTAEPARQRSGRRDLEDERIAAAFAARSSDNQTILLLVVGRLHHVRGRIVPTLLPRGREDTPFPGQGRFRQLVTKELRD